MTYFHLLVLAVMVVSAPLCDAMAGPGHGHGAQGMTSIPHDMSDEEEKVRKKLNRADALAGPEWKKEWEKMSVPEKLEHIEFYRKRAEQIREKSWNNLSDKEKISAYERKREAMEHKLRRLDKGGARVEEERNLDPAGGTLQDY